MAIALPLIGRKRAAVRTDRLERAINAFVAGLNADGEVDYAAAFDAIAWARGNAYRATAMSIRARYNDIAQAGFMAFTADRR